MTIEEKVRALFPLCRGIKLDSLEAAARRFEASPELCAACYRRGTALCILPMLDPETGEDCQVAFPVCRFCRKRSNGRFWHG